MTRRRRRRSRFISALFGQLFLPTLLLAIVLLRLYVYLPVLVNQTSMEPSLREYDRLLVNTWTLRDRLPARGSVVVLVHPMDGHWLVKRVVAVGGDTVGFSPDGLLWLNGEPVQEPYAVPYQGEWLPETAVPQGAVYVVGDNRPSSEDSRDYGPVSAEQLIGEVVAVFWPPEHRRWIQPSSPEQEPTSEPAPMAGGVVHAAEAGTRQP
jgi:signal peptidase I